LPDGHHHLRVVLTWIRPLFYDSRYLGGGFVLLFKSKSACFPSKFALSNKFLFHFRNLWLEPVSLDPLEDAPSQSQVKRFMVYEHRRDPPQRATLQDQRGIGFYQTV
jgi:hypothetical protein